jgi:hypothetical protein
MNNNEVEDIDEVEEINVEEMSGMEVLEQYKTKNRIHNLEMSNGIKALNKICNDLGYSEDQFKYGSSFERFIQDNPAVSELILNYIAEQMDNNVEWKESLVY